MNVSTFHTSHYLAVMSLFFMSLFGSISSTSPQHKHTKAAAQELINTSTLNRLSEISTNKPAVQFESIPEFGENTHCVTISTEVRLQCFYPPLQHRSGKHFSCNPPGACACIYVIVLKVCPWLQLPEGSVRGSAAWSTTTTTDTFFTTLLLL